MEEPSPLLPPLDPPLLVPKIGLRFLLQMTFSSTQNYPDSYHPYPYVPAPRNDRSAVPTKMYFHGKCRLGNLMFQLNGALALARYYGKQLVVNHEMHRMLNATFGFDARGLTSTLYSVERWPHNVTYYNIRKPVYGLNLKLFELNNKQDFILFSWFQSWQYFQHRQKEIRQLLGFSKSVRNKANTALADYLTEWNVSRQEITLIGVHVRRSKGIASQQKLAPMPYFLSAMRYFRRKYHNVFFIVCTSDPKWSNKHFHGLAGTRVVRNAYDVDMAVLASCDHTIMSIGTFGWWSAWLAGGDVIYYNDPVRMIKGLFPANEYYLPGWIPMSN